MLNQLRFLQGYSVVLTIGIVGLFFCRTQFDEITVERINIVESDDSLKMVISNSKRQHPGQMGGKKFAPRERPAGLIFFNAEGDEVGGLVYEGLSKEAYMGLSIDQYKNDQIVQLVYEEEKKNRSYGLRLWDRNDKVPLSLFLEQSAKLKGDGYTKDEINRAMMELTGGEPLKADRLFLGKNKAGEVGLWINDDQGRARIRILVKKNGQPTFELLDENGATLIGRVK